jgi:tetratricopeptide (TPR) repeat protein
MLSRSNCTLFLGKTLSLLLSVFFVLELSAQQTFNRNQKKKIEEAVIFFEFGDFHTSLEMYESLLKEYPKNNELIFKVGESLFHIKGKEIIALNYFERVRSIYPESIYYIARIHHFQELFDTSIKGLKEYLLLPEKLVADSIINRYITIAERAKEMRKHPVNVSIQNLGSSINSAYHDYVPLISADESVLYFTSRRPGGTSNSKDPLGDYFEDIYVSNNVEGTWSKPINLGPPVNSSTHDATVSISSSGSTLIFYRTNPNLTSGDLFISYLKDSIWSDPQLLSKNINSEFQEASACLSPDEKTLYFSSNRPGGFGGKDIYRVVKLPKGDWSLPINLGPSINTAFDEDAPFMHIDGKTLFFSSTGHTTIGGFDVFKSVLQNEETWGVAQNIGYPINTVHDDIYFVLNATGTTGYYSTQKERGFGKQDIYKINLNEYDQGSSIFRGNIKDKGNNNPLRATITILDEEFGDLQGVYLSNSSNGNFILALEPGRKYQLLVEAEGYKTDVSFISFNEENGYEELKKEIFLQSEKDN